MEQNRGQWSSRLGFIFAAAGSAIGLGNIWRFPYVAGQNGGAAFVLIYIGFVVIVGLPYMMAELSLGRMAQKNPVGAIAAVRRRSVWKFAGLLGIITGIGIFSFYGVISGWTVGYIFKTAFGSNGDFASFVSDPVAVILLFAFFISLTAAIVYGGIEHGIEKWSKILMPVLLGLMLALIIYSNTLEGSAKGLSFYLNPDFSKITGKTLLAAMGQAFFSLSLGMGLMITYGSYVSKKDNIPVSAVYISAFDTLVALMAGLVIFPALFAMGENPAEGPALVFVIFPKLFNLMPGGIIVGTIFFTLLSIAALTSTISLLEVPVSYMVDEYKSDRKKIVWKIAAFTFIVGIPSALSAGASEWLTNFGLLPGSLVGPDFLSQMGFIFGEFSLSFGALLLSIFIGWVWGANNAADEIEEGSPVFRKFRRVWIFMIRYFIPALVFIILLNLFGLFD